MNDGEKLKEVDFDSFTESAFEINSEDLPTASEKDQLQGFAELKSCKVSEFTEQVNEISLKENYLIFEAVIHGFEYGIVFVREGSDLHDFMLDITSSENISQLSGQEIPVDKVSDGVYQPSKSLFNDFQLLDWKRSNPAMHIDKGIEFGVIDYNTETQKWELISEEGYSTISNKFETSVGISITLTILSIVLLLLVFRSMLLFSLSPFLLIIFSYIIYSRFDQGLDYLLQLVRMVND